MCFIDFMDDYCADSEISAGLLSSINDYSTEIIEIIVPPVIVFSWNIAIETLLDFPIYILTSGLIGGDVNANFGADF